MLAEATAKAAEHATLLTVLQYQQHQQQQHGLARQEDSYAIAQQQQSAAGSVVRSHMTLAEARAAAGVRGWLGSTCHAVGCCSGLTGVLL